MLFVNVQAQDNITPYFVATVYGDEPSSAIICKWVCDACENIGLKAHLRDDREVLEVGDLSAAWFRVEDNEAYRLLYTEFFNNGELQRGFPSVYAYIAAEIAMSATLIG